MKEEERRGDERREEKRVEEERREEERVEKMKKEKCDVLSRQKMNRTSWLVLSLW